MKETKRLGNKGFSLVELIVVIAIMAVFVGVLSPQYMKWVERARLQKDNSAIGEIAQAMKLAYSDEALRTKIDSESDGKKFTLTNSTVDDAAGFNFTTTPATKTVEKEVEQVVGSKFDTSSKAYKKSTTPIVLELQDDGSVKVTGYYELPTDTAGTTKTF
ncbi:MAG: prepilin-type N-terminal cleavage/methylation domain-containing protein [Acetatifactor sp.]|nr:prepilin-type N-terminal cleavage/methylation domain-containing protein [Acetatifactor sp.]